MSDSEEKNGDGGETIGLGGVDLAGSAYAGAVGAAERAGMRGPGRPKGALNVKTKAFQDYYAAKGYRDPLIALGEFVSANPLDLWSWVRENAVDMAKAGGFDVGKVPVPDLFAIIREQHACAVQLAPYLHGKRPVQVEITDERLPTLALVLGMDQTTFTQKLADEGALTLGMPEPEADTDD